MSLILNIETGLVSPQYHCTYDHLFETTTGTQARSIPKSKWQHKAGFTREDEEREGEPNMTDQDEQTEDESSKYEGDEKSDQEPSEQRAGEEKKTCPDSLCRDIAAPDIPFTCYAPEKYRTFLKLIVHSTSHMIMKECQELQLLCTVS